MFTMVTSSTTISWATPMTARMSHRRSRGARLDPTVDLLVTLRGVRFVKAHDEARPTDVTDDRTRVAGRPIRSQPDAPSRRGLPDARLGERGRRRRTGGLAAPQPRRQDRGREPRRLAHDG